MMTLRLPQQFSGNRMTTSASLFHLHNPQQLPSHLSFSSKPHSAVSITTSDDDVKPIVVVGSANADIYLEVDRLPAPGETLPARSGRTLAGGKGANQACCAARLSSFPTHFVARVGDDAHGRLLETALAVSGVRLAGIQRSTSGEPTGHAVVMLQPDGQNSIVIVGGANTSSWPEKLSEEDADVLRSAGALLLQREIPDWVNVQVAHVANAAGVPVILDAGGMGGSIPKDLLKFIDILSPNETELSQLTGMPTDTQEQIRKAAMACHRMDVKEVLVKLGSKGSALFTEGEEPIWQPIFAVPKVVDTTGAGDTFTAAFAVALVEGNPRRECLQFAAAAASLCVQVMGAMPSMPDRTAVMNLLHSISV